MKMAEKIASELDGEKLGVRDVYVFGSTKNAASGPGSDIDLIVHIDKSKCKVSELDMWFEGWGLALSEVNYLRTGVQSSGLLDIHYVNDDEVKKKTGFAAKIGAITDAARQLKMKT
jgi:predicted nucleotidyltransferase